ncbi:MAG: hypothetical protein GF313_08940 [Caldithrix sp.]|nr:hypothetical protein [Caldithrix sp.]
MSKHNLFDKDNFLSDFEDDQLSEEDKKKKKQQDAEHETPSDSLDELKEKIDPELDDELRERNDAEPEYDEEERQSMSSDLDQKLDRALEELQDEEEGDLDESEPEEMDEMLGEDEEELDESPPPPRRPVIEDYEDDRQEGINYKPILIGGVIVVLLIVAFFVVRSLFFTGDEAQKATTPQSTEPVAKETISEAERARMTFYNEIARNAQGRINLISNITRQVDNKEIYLSSLLFYGEECLFEVFGNDRADLARLNLQFKEQMQQNKLILLTSKIRAGQNGGIFGVYKLELDGMDVSGVSVEEPIKSRDALKSFLNELASAQGVTLNKSKFIDSGTQENYQVQTMEAGFSGNLNGCMNLIGAMGKANKNIELHKIKIMADHPNLTKSDQYTLNFVLKLYI